MPSEAERTFLNWEWQGIDWQLLPPGALYWPQRQWLLVADLHLGKEITFQKAGLALPSGATLATWRRLECLVDSLSVQKVIFLGDLIHARNSLSDQVPELVRTFQAKRQNVELLLIEGNHDRGAKRQLEQWGMTVRPEWLIDGVLLRHDLPFNSRRNPSETPVIHGHWHPGIRMPGEPGRLPCFVIRRSQLILPALGTATGTMAVSFGREDRVVITTNSQVFPVSASLRDECQADRRRPFRLG